MSGGTIKLAETTHYWFGVRYTSNDGIRYRHLSVYRKRPKEEDEWERPEEIEITEYSDPDPRLYEAFDELEKEQSAVHTFSKLSEEQVTLSEIWRRMTEAEYDLIRWKERAEEAEAIINDLNNFRYKKEDKEAEELKA